MSIQVTNLLKIYGEQKAVNGISFTVKKGEIVGFLGPNGAGKSTTMKILTGYLQQDGGTAVVSGVDVSEKPIEVKKSIGYLPESNPLYYDMFVREYLLFKASLHKLDNKKTEVERVIDTVGLSHEAKKKIGQLSKGYKQRVGLAGALIHDPEVLILDEPTSGLDPNQIIEIREVIRQQGKNKTVLFSSHILQEVEAICDRVIIINKGELVADDSLSNLHKATPDKHVVIVQFKEKADIELLEKLPDALMVEEIEKANTQYSKFNIHSSKPEALRKQILQLALDKNLNIISLQSERQSLEEIFRSLTVNKES